jgi:hypothetical protein
VICLTCFAACLRIYELNNANAPKDHFHLIRKEILVLSIVALKSSMLALCQERERYLNSVAGTWSTFYMESFIIETVVRIRAPKVGVRRIHFVLEQESSEAIPSSDFFLVQDAIFALITMVNGDVMAKGEGRIHPE